MSKKPKKSNTASGPAAGWDTALIAAPVQEGMQSFISCLAPHDGDSVPLIEHMSSAIRDLKLRRRFRCITKQDIMNLATQGLDSLKGEQAGAKKSPEPPPTKGGRASKAGKTKQPVVEKPQFSETVDYAQQMMTAKGALSAEMEVRLVKFLLLHQKKEYAKKKEVAKAVYSARKQKVPDAAPAPAKGKGKTGKEKTAKKGKEPVKTGPAAPPPPLKMFSGMKTRAEEEEDSTSVDDEPQDGPELYFVLAGFHDVANLLSELGKVGVHSDVLMRLSQAVPEDGYAADAQAAQGEERPSSEGAGSASDAGAPPDDQSSKPDEQAAAESTPDGEADSCNEEERLEQLRRVEAQVVEFWSASQAAVDASPHSSVLRDMAWHALASHFDPSTVRDKITLETFKVEFYELFAFELYLILKEQRAHKIYLACLQAPAVPRLTPAMKEDGTGSTSADSTPVHGAVRVQENGDVFDTPMELYRRLADSVPMEFASVPVLLDCMVAQVCHTVAELSLEPPVEEGFEETFMRCVRDAVDDPAEDEDELGGRNSSKTGREVKEGSASDDTVFHEGDGLSQRHAHVRANGAFDYVAAEAAMRARSPLAYLARPVAINATEDRDQMARLHELEFAARSGFRTPLSFLKAMRQLCLEGMQPNVDTLLARSVDVVDTAWDDPLPGFAAKEGGLGDAMAAATTHWLDEWCVEKFQPRGAVAQVLEEAYQRHRCCTVANLKSLQRRLVCMHGGNLAVASRHLQLQHRTLFMSPTGFQNFRTHILPLIGEELDREAERTEADRVVAAARKEAAAKEAEARAAAEQAETATKATAGKGRKSVASKTGPTPSPASRASKASGSKRMTPVPPTAEESDVPQRKLFFGCDFGLDSVVQLRERHAVLSPDRIDGVSMTRHEFDGGLQSWTVRVEDGNDVFRVHRVARAEQHDTSPEADSSPSAVSLQTSEANSDDAAAEAANEAGEAEDSDDILREFEALPVPQSTGCVFSGYQAGVGDVQIAGSWYANGLPPALADDFSERMRAATAELRAIGQTPPETPAPEKQAAAKGKKQQQQQAEAERLEAERVANEERRGVLAEQRREILAAARAVRLRPRYPHTALCLPNGLHVAFSVQHSADASELTTQSLEEPGVVCVRQRYLLPATAGNEELERAVDGHADAEAVRCVHDDGTVVVLKRKGDCEVMRPDGSVTRGDAPVMSTAPPGSARPRSDAADGDATKDAGLARSWSFFKADGSKAQWPLSDEVPTDGAEEDMPVRRSSDFDTKERRTLLPNKVQIIERSNGDRIVAFTDGTVATTTGAEGDVLVECPGYLPVAIPGGGNGLMEVRVRGGTCVSCSSFGRLTVRTGDGAMRMDVAREGLLCGDHRHDEDRRGDVDGDDERTSPTPPVELHAHGERLCSARVGGRLRHLCTDGALVDDDDVRCDRDVATAAPRPAGPAPGDRTARFFVVNDDGSGEELIPLRRLARLEEDFTAVPNSGAIVQYSNDPESGIRTTTTMRPHNPSMSTDCLPRVVPPTPFGTFDHRMRERIPPLERPGNGVGSRYGKVLNVGLPSSVTTAKCTMPLEYKSLVIQQYVQHPVMGTSGRGAITAALHECVPQYRERERRHRERQSGANTAPSPTPEARELQRLYGDLARRPATDLGSLRSEYDCRQSAQDYEPETPTQRARQGSGNGSVQSHDMDNDWLMEKALEQENRELFRSKRVPAYFRSDVGQQALGSLEQLASESPDMDYLASRLAKAVRVPPSPPPQPSVPGVHVTDGTAAAAASKSEVSLRASSTMSEADIPDGAGDGSINASASSLATPVPRPVNPTPHGATTMPPPLASGSVVAATTSATSIASVAGTGTGELRQMTRSMPTVSHPPSKLVNASGQLRKVPVPTPAVLKATRAGAARNEQYLETDGGGRRRVHTSSVQQTASDMSALGHTEADIVHRLHGFLVQPSSLHFGRLLEGCTYHVTFSLLNTGVDSGRFRIKQPPPATGMVILSTTDLVAAGMKATVVVEIAAMAVGIIAANGVGKVYHELEIVTETDIIALPISATVIPYGDGADGKSPARPEPKPAPNVKLVSDRPTSRDGLGRLRKPR